MIGSKNSFFYKVAHTLGTRVFSFVLLFIYGVATARVFGPEGKGILAAVMVIPQFVLSLGELGLRQSIAYYTARKTYSNVDLYGNVFSLLVITSIISVLTVFSIFQITGYLEYGLSLILLATLIIPFELTLRYGNGIFLGKMQIIKMNRVIITGDGLKLALFFLLSVALGLGVSGAFIANLITSVLIAVYMIYCIRISIGGQIGFKWNLPLQIKLLRKGMVFAVSLLVLQLNYRIDVLMVEKMLGAENVGIYSVGVSIVELIKYIPLSIGVVLWSKVANEQNPDDFAERAVQLARIVFTGMIFSGVLLFVISPWIIPVLYGSKFAVSAEVVRVLLPGILVLCLFLELQLFRAGTGEPQWSMYAFGPAVLLNIALNFYLIPQYGEVGAGMASTLSYSLGVFIFLLLFRRKYKIRWKDFILINKQDIKFVSSYFKHK